MVADLYIIPVAVPSLVPKLRVPTGGPPAMFVLIVRVTVPEASLTV